MVVLSLRSHAAHVEAEHPLDGEERRRQVLIGVRFGHRDRDIQYHLEVVRGVGQLLGIHLGSVRRVVEGQPAVGDLGRLGNVPWPLGPDEDRDVSP